jgi:DNA polymerase III sliding clamp (beta) subunit (PCNA family)
VAHKEQNRARVFEFPQGRTVIKAEADGTQATAELSQTHVSGKACKIGFDHTYLTQYVKSVETEKVSMRLFPQSLAEVALFDSFRYRHLLMPLRV